MNLIKATFVICALTIGSFAHAGTLKCTSVGEYLPENRLNFEVTLQTNWLGTVVKSGSYTYKGVSTEETGSGQFACLEPNDKGVVFCGAIAADTNIQSIVVHPVLGFMFQISGQEHVVLFNCK